MKKMLCLLFSFLIFNLQSTPIDFHPDNLLCNEVISIGKEYKPKYDLNDVPYYAFMYDGYNWFIENIVGEYNFKKGYLYVKNLTDLSVKCLLNVQIDNLITVGYHDIFFIYENNIYRTDYEGTFIDNIYLGTDLSKAFCLDTNGFYFQDNNILKEYLFDQQEVKTYCCVNTIDKIIPLNYNELYLIDVDNERFVFNKGDNSLFATDQDASSQYRDDIDYQTVTLTQNNANLTELITQYPLNNSYFANAPGQCWHSHCIDYATCKKYGKVYQCRGYALYAYDKYSHRGSWTSVAGDYHIYATSSTEATSSKPYIPLSTTNDVSTYFATVPKGAYILLKNTGNGVHAIFYLGIYNSKLLTYECNYFAYKGSDGKWYTDCKITTPNRPYSSISDKYSYVKEAYWHLFNGSIESYDATYHKICCSTNSCGGYIIELHIFRTNNLGLMECRKCGYITGGNIHD